jgi:hypothetical protein
MYRKHSIERESSTCASVTHSKERENSTRTGMCIVCLHVHPLGCARRLRAGCPSETRGGALERRPPAITLLMLAACMARLRGVQFRALGLITFLGVCIVATTLLNGFYQRQSLIQHEGSADGESFWVEQVLVIPCRPRSPSCGPVRALCGRGL